MTKVLVLVCCLGLLGCQAIEFLLPEKPPSNEQIAYGYDRTMLERSSAADVLSIIHNPKYELLSQSTSVIASVGEKKGGYKTWFSMVAFDEDDLRARRKYLFIEDESPKVLQIDNRAELSFYCEIVLGGDVLHEPYADENARIIAILEQVLESTRKDVAEVSADNKVLAVGGMLINQAFQTVLVKLEAGPAQAMKLDDPAGFKFGHVSYNEGKIQMFVLGNTAIIKMRLGSSTGKFGEVR